MDFRPLLLVNPTAPLGLVQHIEDGIHQVSGRLDAQLGNAGARSLGLVDDVEGVLPEDMVRVVIGDVGLIDLERVSFRVLRK